MGRRRLRHRPGRAAGCSWSGRASCSTWWATDADRPAGTGDRPRRRTLVRARCGRACRPPTTRRPRDAPAARSPMALDPADRDGGRGPARPDPAGRPGGGPPMPVRPAGRGARPSPRLADGTPFPTLYYLTCPRATGAVSTLESAGLMREMSARLADRSGAGRARTGRRTSATWPGGRGDRAGRRRSPGVSAGGMPTRVKCLHVHLAQALAEGPGRQPVRRRDPGAGRAVVDRRPLRASDYRSRARSPRCVGRVAPGSGDPPRRGASGSGMPARQERRARASVRCRMEVTIRGPAAATCARSGG